MNITRIGSGAYRVEINGQNHIVYVAGPAGDRWASCDGQVYRLGSEGAPPAPRSGSREGAQALSAPMPATVLKVLVAPGAHVKKSETLVILEAMKMELPLRSPADAVVRAVHCREGELVQPDVPLVELE